MILLADSGATKTTWSVLKERNELLRFETEGYNPHFVTGNYIASSLEKNLDRSFSPSAIEAVYFYGAGCNADRSDVISAALKHVFWTAEVFVASELLAAARSVLGSKRGFAALLGTGANTCMYDGENIALNIDSLGFILGDEGSGAYLGKKVLQDYLRGHMPGSVEQRFKASYPLSHESIIYDLYAAPLANRYCARFCEFLVPHCQYSVEVVKNAFREFFTNLVCRYTEHRSFSFNCVGSVAYVFQDILKEVALEFQISTDKVVKSPMDGLIAYHLEQRLP